MNDIICDFISKVNCEKEKMTCKKHKITGYPKIITFHEGMQVSYSLNSNPNHLKFETFKIVRGLSRLGSFKIFSTCVTCNAKMFLILLQKALYQGDRSFENLKYFVEDMIKDYLGSTKSTSDEPVGLGDENGETEPLPDEPVPVEAPESTDDVTTFEYSISNISHTEPFIFFLNSIFFSLRN